MNKKIFLMLCAGYSISLGLIAAPLTEAEADKLVGTHLQGSGGDVITNFREAHDNEKRARSMESGLDHGSLAMKVISGLSGIVTSVIAGIATNNQEGYGYWVPMGIGILVTCATFVDGYLTKAQSDHLKQKHARVEYIVKVRDQILQSHPFTDQNDKELLQARVALKLKEGLQELLDEERRTK